MHNIPIARIGCLAIFNGVIVGLLLFADVSTELRVILFGSVVIVVMALVDDLIDLKYWIKLIVQIVAALIAVSSGVVIEVVSNPNIFSSNPWLILGVFSIPITVIWIVAITNSVNFIDGLDGLAVGSLNFGNIYARNCRSGIRTECRYHNGSSCWRVHRLSPYNLNPAKIFMGDTGALFIGYILATVSIQGLFKFYAIMSFAVPFLILGLPIFDFLFAFFRRLLTGKNPMKADRGHVHHRLIDMGFNQKQVVAIMYIISGILGLSAVVLAASGELRAVVMFVGIAIIAALSARLYLSGRPNNNRHNATPEITKDTIENKDVKESKADKGLES